MARRALAARNTRARASLVVARCGLLLLRAALFEGSPSQSQRAPSAACAACARWSAQRVVGANAARFVAARRVASTSATPRGRWACQIGFAARNAPENARLGTRRATLRRAPTMPNERNIFVSNLHFRSSFAVCFSNVVGLCRARAAKTKTRHQRRANDVCFCSIVGVEFVPFAVDCCRWICAACRHQASRAHRC